MKKLQEKEMEKLVGNGFSCGEAIIAGAAIGFVFGGMGAFGGALLAAASPVCTGLH